MTIEYTKRKTRGLPLTLVSDHHCSSFRLIRPPKLTGPQKGEHERRERFEHGPGLAHQNLDSKYASFTPMNISIPYLRTLVCIQRRTHAVKQTEC